MALPPDVPSWCRVRSGGSALLLVAPHGGARGGVRPARGTVKVNDLHTAALAEALAHELDAGLIANPVLDRNELDLNRISQVARAAAWFPALLESLLADILARHPRAEVLFLHGWNTLQPKCDIGIGHALRDPADAADHAAALTTSVDYVATRLAALRAACAARGIAAPLGERYPARHANNVLQLFRRRAGHQLAPRLGEWSSAGRIDAVQLELAAPLRWSGPLRAAFATALRETFAAPASATSPGIARRAATAPPPPARTATGLQVYDAASGIGLMARVDPADGGRVSGRLLLFLGGSRVALFTGDDDHPALLSGGGPHFTEEPNGVRLRFDGWALCADDGRLYVDLERALTASHLLAVRADLVFNRRAGDHGRVRGALALDGVERAVDAIGFAPVGGVGRPADIGWRSHISLRAGLADGAVVSVRHRVPGGAWVEEHGDAAPIARAVATLAVTFEGDPHSPGRIAVDDDAGGLIAEPTSRMAIVRPLAGGRRARVTFGVARVECAGRPGFGFYEYARVID